MGNFSRRALKHADFDSMLKLSFMISRRVFLKTVDLSSCLDSVEYKKVTLMFLSFFLSFPPQIGHLSFSIFFSLQAENKYFQSKKMQYTLPIDSCIQISCSLNFKGKIKQVKKTYYCIKLPLFSF